MTDSFLSVGHWLAFLLGLGIGGLLACSAFLWKQPPSRGHRTIFQTRIDLFEAKNKVIEVEVPANAVFRRMRDLGSHGILWFEGSPNGQSTKKRLHCLTTGTTIPADAGDYLGTISVWGNQQVLHIYEAE